MEFRPALSLVLLVCLAPCAARAEWLQASSAHFVVYADDSERDVRTFAQQLERFHAAISTITNTQHAAPSPSNRVTVYVVGSGRQVRKLYGEGSRGVGAFYMPRAGGSLAIVPEITTGTTELDFSMIMLLHEYAHHFMISNSGFPMPLWYSEGSAEFFASASFAEDGSVGIGQPAQHRADELFFARDVAVSDLLESSPDQRARKSGNDAFYGKSWLLFHYLTFSPERSGQIGRYLQLLSQGRSSRDAGLEAFGNPATLEKELDAYMKRSKMVMVKLPASKLQTGPISIQRLGPGEAAMMPIRIRSRRGVDREQAAALLPQARAVAARFPEDPAVLAALAEAEHDAGNDRESIAAADAALAKDPSQVNAYVQKGLSLFRMAESGGDANAYAQARAPFLALNRMENDHPVPLIYYYLSFILQDKEPPAAAVNGLRRAAELAPFDTNLRMTLALQQIRSRELAQARTNLAVIAYHPHGGGMAEAAQRIMARIDGDPQWDGSDFEQVANGSSAGSSGTKTAQ